MIDEIECNDVGYIAHEKIGNALRLVALYDLFKRERKILDNLRDAVSGFGGCLSRDYSFNLVSKGGASSLSDEVLEELERIANDDACNYLSALVNNKIKDINVLVAKIEAFK